MNTKPIGPFLGLNNRLPMFSLHVDKKGDYLSAADNINIDNAGNVNRRDGYELIQAMTGAHSLFNNLLVRDSVLYAIEFDPYSETLIKLLTSNGKMSYVEHDGSTYYSNGTDSGRISGGIWYPWALPTPSAPACTSIAGSLPAGRYQVSVAYFNSVTGEEGGASASTAHELTAAGAIQVTLPAVTPGATHANVFISKLNGDVPGLHSSVILGTATIDLTSTETTRTQSLEYVEPLPAGSRLFIHMGRLCAVNGKFLYYCEPYRFGYYQPHKGFIRLESDISVSMPNQMGVYLVADKTHWIPGDLMTPEAPMSDVLPFGAVPGTEFEFTHNASVGWMGAEGFVIANQQGQAETPTIEAVSMSNLPASGCSTVIDQEGHRRVVSCGYCLNLETGAVTTYSNYAFTSMSGDYGTMATGLYRMAGGSDAGEEIIARVGFGKQNFGSENKKVMPACYVGVDSPEPVELTIKTPRYPDGFVYPSRFNGDDLQTQRIDPGLGLESNWFYLELANTAGADFMLASVSFAPVATGRRI